VLYYKKEGATMTINWDYIAGFTDGEGYIGIVGRGPIITWGQKDIRPLEAMYEFLLGEGYHPAFGRRKGIEGRDGLYYINLGRRDEVAKFAEVMSGRLVLKYPACEKVLKWMQDNPSKASRGEVEYKKFSMLVNQGYTIKEIANRLNCSVSKLYRFYSKYKVTFKSGGVVQNGKHIQPMTKEEWLAHRAKKEKNNKCVDCGKSIYPGGERCVSCALRHRHQTKPESFKASDIKFAPTVKNPSEELA